MLGLVNMRLGKIYFCLRPPGLRKGAAVPIQTTTRIITFRSPVRLAGLAGELPAGSYLVETDELIDAEPASSALHVATFLRLPQPRGPSSRLHSLPIDPLDLAAVLESDRVRTAARTKCAKSAPETGTEHENA